MADPTLFRSAVTEDNPTTLVDSKGGEVSDTSGEYSELPPSLYIEAHKVPLVLELISGTSAYEHFDMKSLAQEIDRYIGENIVRKGLEDSREDYDKVLQEALDILKFPEGTDVYSMVEKLVRHFRIQHKLYSALKEREELMTADPLTLSAPKLKLYLERGYASI